MVPRTYQKFSWKNDRYYERRIRGNDRGGLQERRKEMNKINFSVSVLLTFFTAWVKKVPLLFLFFLIAVTIDYFTGYMKAKYFTHEWCSKIGLRGLLKKIMYFILIATAFLIGYCIMEIGLQFHLQLGYAIYIGWYVTAVMLLNEITSILENLYVIIPEKVPAWLVKALKIADEQLDYKINQLVCKNQDCEKCELQERCNLKNIKRKEGK